MAVFVATLCAILVLTMLSGAICRKTGLPEVVGQIVVGIVFGPTVLGLMQPSSSTELFSNIGIIVLMFLGGVGCDLGLLKRYSKAALIVACMGVVAPVLIMGGVSMVFGFDLMSSLFIGVVFSATSVSISVAVLKETGRLDTKEGASILGAAVADDVIGVILLSIMSTLISTGSVSFQQLGLIALKQVAFFALTVVVVLWVAPWLMTFAALLKAPSGIAIMATIICLAMAWCSELVGLSYAVGAFFAGIAVSRSDYRKQVDRDIEPIGDCFFVPLFFVSIGLNTEAVHDMHLVWFIVVMTVLGVITKIVGCGLGARMAGFNGRSSIVIGTGMIPRGEMALITAQIGFSQHILSDDYYSTIIFTISLVTLIAPLFLKAALHGAPAKDEAAGDEGAKTEAPIEADSATADIIDAQTADTSAVGMAAPVA
ncbi:cation:proton antiporter [Bifidobacterium boum]|uniref:cation:proton antiporter n=1 Tax=Bifidobacterium boum TaxID=78343 RepID=UPI003F8E28A7